MKNPEIDSNGTQKWFNKNGRLHRENGPAVIDPNGDQCWYNNGRKHRDDGPAMILTNGTQKWFQDGKYHRLDGPAVIWPEGDQYWYINGDEYSEIEYYKELLSQTTNPNQLKSLKSKIIKLTLSQSCLK